MAPLVKASLSKVKSSKVAENKAIKKNPKKPSSSSEPKSEKKVDSAAKETVSKIEDKAKKPSKTKSSKEDSKSKVPVATEAPQTHKDSKVNPEQIGKAVKALIQHEKVSKATANELFDGDSATIWLTLGLKKRNENVKSIAKSKPIAIKHSLRKSLPLGICLFVKDPQADYKPLMEKVPEITKVIGVSKLGAKYKSFEAKRNLCASYDFFLADSRILPMLPKKLGKGFFLKKKQPVAIDLDTDRKSILAGAKKSIHALEMAIHKQTHMFDSLGTCLSIKIGHTNMVEKEVTENVIAALPAIVEKIPGKWDNILSINLKTGNSISLPIFNSPVEVIMSILKGGN